MKHLLVRVHPICEIDLLMFLAVLVVSAICSVVLVGGFRGPRRRCSRQARAATKVQGRVYTRRFSGAIFLFDKGNLLVPVVEEPPAGGWRPPNAGAAGLEPNTEPAPCGGCDEAPEKLKDGGPPGAEAPPNIGPELLPDWLAPNMEPPEGAGVDELAPAPAPNWNGVDEPLAGPDEVPPKVKAPPVDVPGAVLELPAKGLLKDVPEVAEGPPALKLKLKPPDPAFADDSAPNETFELPA